jgi:hypothetical protein
MARKTSKASADDTQDDPADMGEPPVIKTRVILKKKDFIDRAIERSGLRKADAKAAVEATLAVLAEALAKGEELVLPPLGKIKVAREKAHPRGRILMLRLQLTPDEAGEFTGGTEPLAEAAE